VLEGWALPSVPSGHLEFFIERVVRAESRDAE
jgi:hypothetical protein